LAGIVNTEGKTALQQVESGLDNIVFFWCKKCQDTFLRPPESPEKHLPALLWLALALAPPQNVQKRPIEAFWLLRGIFPLPLRFSG
jgi:hypothetical protein